MKAPFKSSMNTGNLSLEEIFKNFDIKTNDLIEK
jgi:hypothetical protein